MKIKIIAGNIQVNADLENTNTASVIFNALPIESTAHLWGEEIYFNIPVELELEDGKEILEEGDIAYWPSGKSMCIFFGPTPSSKGEEIRAYSPVSVFGRVSDDAKKLKKVREGDRIRVEAL